MLETGREILQEEGIQTGSTNLTFKRVFDRVERDTGRRLSNASVIKRIWANQADYQADVLVTIAHDEQRPEVERHVGRRAAGAGHRRPVDRRGATGRHVGAVPGGRGGQPPDHRRVAELVVVGRRS